MNWLKRKKRTNQSRRSMSQAVERNTIGRTYYRSDTIKKPYDFQHKNTRTASTDSPSIPEKKKKRRVGVSQLINGGLVLSFLLFGFLATTLSSSVVVLVPEGSFVYRDAQEYEQYVKQLLQDSPLQRSKLLFRSSAFEDAFIERFPEVRQVEAIVPVGGRSLTVAVGLSEPLAYVRNGNDVGIADASGVIAALLDESNLEQQLTLPTITYLEKQQYFSEGARVFTGNEVQLISLLEKELDTFTLSDADKTSLDTVTYTLSVSRGRLEVNFANKPYYARFNTFGDPQEQVGKLKATLRALSQSGEMPSTYIDLRVEGRVFIL